MCVCPRVRERGREKREGRRERSEQKTRRPRQGPRALPGACSACLPCSSPGWQAFLGCSAGLAEQARARIPRGRRENRRQSHKAQSPRQRGPSPRPGPAGLQSRRNPLRAVTREGSPGPLRLPAALAAGVAAAKPGSPCRTQPAALGGPQVQNTLSH